MRIDTKLSIPMIIALAIAGMTLCVVSIWYTIDLLRTLGVNESEKALMTVTAIGFEACKFAFIPIAFALLSHKKGLQGTMIFFLGLALVGVSMVASLGFLAAKTDQGIETARIESDEYKAGQKQLKNIENSIALLSAAAAIDAQSQWKQARENAAKKVLAIEKLEEKRSLTVEAMKNIDAMNKTDTGALFIALGNGWNMKAEDAKKLCYIVVALLLELCAIAALSLAGIGAFKTKSKAPIRQEYTASKGSTSLNASAASTEAPVASVEAASNDSSVVKKQLFSKALLNQGASRQSLKSKKLQSTKSTPVYDFTEYADERKKVGQEKQAAHQAKVDLLKVHNELARETKAIATEAAKIREGFSDQAEELKRIAEQKAKNAIVPKVKPAQKRSSKITPKTKSAFDENLLVRMQHEVKSGQVKGSIRSLQSAYSLGFPKAQMYHERLKQLGVVLETSANRTAHKA